MNICASRLLGFTLQIFLERFRGIAGAIFLSMISLNKVLVVRLGLFWSCSSNNHDIKGVFDLHAYPKLGVINSTPNPFLNKKAHNE